MTLLCIGIVVAFYLIDNARMATVKGTRARYVLTGWSWMLLWAAYAGALVMVARGIVGHDALTVFLCCLHVMIIRVRHARLVRDDDDNPWRKLKRSIKSAIKRLRAVRVTMPQLVPSPAPTPA